MRTSYYLSRTLCDALAEMRKCSTTKNYSYLDGLIEEAQCMANRMEAGLEKAADIKEMEETWHNLRKQIKGLKHEKDGLVENIKRLKEKKGSV